MSATETCRSFASVPMAGKYMLADNGDSRPIKDMVKTFCVCVKVENGGSEFGSVRSVLAAFSTSTSGLLVAFSLPVCVSVMVEARVALGCCIMVSKIGQNQTCCL